MDWREIHYVPFIFIFLFLEKMWIENMPKQLRKHFHSFHCVPLRSLRWFSQPGPITAEKVKEVWVHLREGSRQKQSKTGQLEKFWISSMHVSTLWNGNKRFKGKKLETVIFCKQNTHCEMFKLYAKYESQAENVHYQDCQTTLHYHFPKSRAWIWILIVKQMYKEKFISTIVYL